MRTKVLYRYMTLDKGIFGTYCYMLWSHKPVVIEDGNGTFMYEDNPKIKAPYCKCVKRANLHRIFKKLGIKFPKLNECIKLPSGFKYYL